MSVKYVVSVFAAALVGFAISPSFSAEVISCNGFESCPTDDGDAIVALTVKVIALEALLADVSRVTDANTSQDTLRFSGMNVQVVDGSGTTGGDTTGTGNLIIGYNELRTVGNNLRGGSHMLVVGHSNNYSSFGGIVAGASNNANGQLASVVGGLLNTADGNFSSLSGGMNNTASQTASSVSGGINNTASGVYSAVSGGLGRNASGESCWEGDLTENC